MENPGPLVFCIFSYNRYRYLQNLIDSIDAFFPDNPVVIFDDNSDQQELLSYFRILKEKAGYSIEKLKSYKGLSKHGGLYDLMNAALKYCWQRNFKYAFFIQDDMQFVQRIDLEQLCDDNFGRRKDVLMISPLFMQKIFLPDLDTYIEEREGDYFFKNRGVADAGIIDLNKAKTVVLEFSARGEKFNGEKYFKLGFRLLLCKNPCLAWVPWALSFKSDSRIGTLIFKEGSFFIKPLVAETRNKLENNEKLPFLEDFTRLNIWWIPKPYLHLVYNFKNVVNTYFRYWRFVIFKK